MRTYGSVLHKKLDVDTKMSNRNFKCLSLLFSLSFGISSTATAQANINPGLNRCAVPHEICLPSDKLNEFGGTFHARTQKI